MRKYQRQSSDQREDTLHIERIEEQIRERAAHSHVTSVQNTTSTFENTTTQENSHRNRLSAPDRFQSKLLL